VVDLRGKCGLAATEPTERTCIAVVELRRDKDRPPVGLMVDGRAEALSLAGDEIEIAFGREVRVPDVLGLAGVKDKVTILLDIDRAPGQPRDAQSASRIAIGGENGGILK
jgi:chemotaxis signal transduction protein